MSSIFDIPKAALDLSARRRYLVLIAYFVGATYLIPSSAVVERFSFIYFALVVPAWIYVLLNWKWLFKGYTPASLCLVVFIGGATVVALVQENPALAYNAFFLASIAIVILNSRVYITPRELNILFLFCLAGSVAIYWSGITDYGFLPGQAKTPSCHEAMNFRISLFRLLTESAILSLFVMITNFFFAQRGCLVVPFLISVLALYFLLLGGIRTMVLALVVVSPILLYQSWKLLRPIRLQTIALAMLIPLGLAAALYLGGKEQRREVFLFVQNYVFRTASCDAIIFEAENKKIFEVERKTEKIGNSKKPIGVFSTDKGAAGDMFGVSNTWLKWTINRSCNVSYHLYLIIQSPWVGNRSLAPESEDELLDVGCQPGSLTRYCEACTFPTYWLGKAGIAAVPLLLSFFVLLMTAVLRRDLFSVACLLGFGVISMGWGVSFVPYNIALLFIVSVPAMSMHRPQTMIPLQRLER